MRAAARALANLVLPLAPALPALRCRRTQAPATPSGTAHAAGPGRRRGNGREGALLRARLDDLPMLVEHVRRQVTARHGPRIDGVTDDALRRLAEHCWPGNLRELEAVLQEAMLLRGRGWLRAEDVAFPAPVPAPSGGTPPPASVARPSGRAARRDLALDLAPAASRRVDRRNDWIPATLSPGGPRGDPMLDGLEDQLRRVRHDRAVHLGAGQVEENPTALTRRARQMVTGRQ